MWMIGGGRIYALLEGKMPLPLFGVQGARYVKLTPEGDQFRMHVRDWAYFTDLDSGELLTEYENPYTGETNKPEPLLTRFFSWTMGPNGQHIDGFTGKAWLMGKPLRMPWSFSGDDASVTLELLVEYANGHYGAEWVNMMTSTAALLAPEASSAPMRYSWTGYSPWARWMNMGDRPGRTLWNSNGRKSDSPEGMRSEVRAVFDKLFPGSLENPETYEKTSGLTTTSEA